ncbi:hypothetical protein CCACVL1_26322 [Corchorus capsularis]|uniref:mitogen-activated protein kinase kinase kinase n=1 Tax=Corchorus capsularis TaxID=210143 RepID=A0A1R3GF64_COCAP|nr:hypothetical protein CCACVL1_26322 [Corchorus capsularis]
MRWLQNISFSSSSSSSSSTTSAATSAISPGIHSQDSNNYNHRNSKQRSKSRYHYLGFRIAGPKLTRERELRRLSDREFSSPKESLSRSPSCYETPLSLSAPTSRTTSLAVPLPLPLPVPEGDGEQRLPSPNDVGHGKGDFSQDEFRINATVMKSVSTSPLSSSPVISPHRKSTGDMFLPYMVPTGNLAWSAPEMAIDNTGLPPPAFYDYNAYNSTEHTPLPSPPNRSPRRRYRSQSGSSSPIHQMLSLEISSIRPDVHRLPLPPVSALASPSASTPHVTTKAEPLPILPMNSQWQKGKLIGRGTFGSVYVASNRQTGALCAMKEVEIFPDDPKSAECMKQLQQEINILSQLKHPNIVQYYGSEIVEDKFYIYLEYVHPGSINKYVREHCGAITESVVRNFTRHILSGLAYLHSTKTIHRDIKGANLLVDASGVVKLADFGMSKHLSGQRADLSLKGSPYWMAPELMQAVMQKDNSSDLALAIDIWSLGCTIIEMFTGKAPWSEYEGAAAMFKVMRDTPPIPETLSPEGKDFLRCCFRRNPAERPSASMLLEHRFVKSSSFSVASRSNSPSNGRRSMEMPLSPIERPEFKLDQLPVQQSLRSTISVTSDSETAQRSHHKTSDLMAAPRYSPRSTLEALPGLSPPRSVVLAGMIAQRAALITCAVTRY